MKVSTLKYTLLSWTSGLAMLMIVLLPFHAFVTVWLGSSFGHYTAVRLWKEGLLLLAAISTICLLLTDQKIRTHTLTRRLAWVIMAYIALIGVWGLVSLHAHRVTAKAFGYGLIVDTRFLIFFLIMWVLALRMSRLRNNALHLMYLPAVIVVVFGLLQIFVLPPDVLRHFGYGPNTIAVSETINSNSHYHRIASTLRGANPLGAYLILPISALTVLLARPQRNTKQAVFLLATLLVLLFSFSRSAWIGAAVAIAVAVMLAGSKQVRRVSQVAAAGLVILALLAGFALRDNAHFQNVIFHTETKSAIKNSSNQGHRAAIEAGLHDIEAQPLGSGTGTAGPASVYNGGHSVRIAEDYYIQIGQEVGWVGTALFVLITAGVGYLLWLRRADPLALSLFASLVGLTFVNLLSHAWADDTLAYIWWGLAGVAIAQPPKLRGTDE